MVYFLLKKVRASYFGYFPSIYILNQYFKKFFMLESIAVDSVFRIRRNLSNQKLCHVKSCFSNREHVGCFSKRSKWQIFLSKKSHKLPSQESTLKTKQNFGYTYNSVVQSPVVFSNFEQIQVNTLFSMAGDSCL